MTASFMGYAPPGWERDRARARSAARRLERRYPSEPLVGYQVLMRKRIAETLALAAAAEAGEDPPEPPWGLLARRAWAKQGRGAVGTQMRLARQDWPEASATVNSAVNQMVFLAIRAEWFRKDASLRQAAIDETIRYAIFRSDVPSRRAQEEWNRAGRHEEDAFLAWDDWADRPRRPV